MTNAEIRERAQAEGKRLARIVFRRRLNRETIPLTERQFAEYLAMMFEAGALWALDGETRK